MQTDHKATSPAAWPELATLHKALDARDSARWLWESAHAHAVHALTDGATVASVLQQLHAAWQAAELANQSADRALFLCRDRLRDLGHPFELTAAYAAAPGGEVG